MPIPIVALGVAGAAALVALRARSGSAADADAGPAVDVPQPDAGDTMSNSPATPTDLSARTLSWRSELELQAPELDTSVLLRWIQRESDGDPMAVGSVAQVARDGWAREAGIGQVYFESRTDRVFGVTSDELRAEQVDRAAQTSSLIEMAREYLVDGAHVLGQLGVSWQSSDLYCLCKLKHALPVLSNDFLRQAPDPSSWDTFRSWLESLSLDDSLTIYHGSATYYPWTRYLNNAQYTGRGD